MGAKGLRDILEGQKSNLSNVHFVRTPSFALTRANAQNISFTLLKATKLYSQHI